jgi:hypothetical protein
MDPILVLTDATDTYYLLPHRPFGDPSWEGRTTTWSTADGSLTLHRKSDANVGAADWYRTPGAPQLLTATRTGKQVRTGWKLDNPAAASDVYPEFVAEGSRRDEDTSAFTALYSPVYERAADEVMTVGLDGMVVVAEGAAPAPADGLTYTANLLEELRRHPEVVHLFPGRLVGFREAVVEAINTQPYMHSTGGGLFSGSHASVDRDRPGFVVAHRSVPYEPRHTRIVHDELGRGRRSRRGREVVESKRLDVRLQVPSAIAGKNRAEAVEKWHAAMAEILAEVEEALTSAPCWHCQGTGVVSAKATAGAASR